MSAASPAHLYLAFYIRPLSWLFIWYQLHNCTQVAVHLHIFSFLDAQSLCRLSQTCDYLHSLAGDPLLWTRMLRRDVHTWRVIGHLSHPKVYEDTSSDLSPKQM